MTTRCLALVALACTPLLTAACASDTKGGGGSRIDAVIKKEIGELVPFDVVELDGPFQADIRVGSGPDLDVEGPTYLIKALDVHVGSDKLILKVDEDLDVQEGDWIKISLDTPALTALTIAGHGKTTVQAPVGESLAVDIRGASTLGLSNVNVGQLTIGIAGAADVTAAGTAKQATYRLSGAGAFTAQELVAEDVSVNLSGAGSVRVHATKRIKGAVSGIGKLAVAGSPAERDVKVAGIGDVVYE